MNAREQILSGLAAQAVSPEPLPDLDGPWIAYSDRVEQFALAVAQAAGRVVHVEPSGLERAVHDLPVVVSAGVVCSFAPEVTGKCAPPSEPHAFSGVDVLVVAASFGVAENGAVWLPEAATPVRAGAFLAEHLVVLLRRDAIVDNMHDAYARLGTELGSYGCFVAGPSKTADIEQALVVGAHGPRSLTIVLH
jgi:L-lactate dehydrogenase complex protein LldG